MVAILSFVQYMYTLCTKDDNKAKNRRHVPKDGKYQRSHSPAVENDAKEKEAYIGLLFSCRL